MEGESDLGKLLASLEPILSERRYSFMAADNNVLDAAAFALVREEEGITMIRESAAGDWARVSLAVHSSLDAVGLTAALSRTLADHGISANVVAAMHHDHVFVPWNRREEALAVLRSLSAAA